MTNLAVAQIAPPIALYNAKNCPILKTILDPKSATLMSILSQTSAMVLIKDNNDQIVWTNASKEFNSLLEENQKADQLVGTMMSDWLHFVPRDKYFKIDQEVIRTGKPQVNLVEIIKKRVGDGSQHMLRIDKLPFLSLDMERIGVITYAINMTTSLQDAVEKYEKDIRYLNLKCAVDAVVASLQKNN